MTPSQSRPATRIGFALTQHCNLRCPHCIRDDVTTVVELDVELVLRVLAEARALLGTVDATFTGGEPMLHRDWPRLLDGLRALDMPYSFISNGWHIRRFPALIERWRPSGVRLSLSGATQDVHDEERGRDSFRRVLLTTAVLASRAVPASYSIIIDRRTRHQIGAALELARSMGVTELHYILPQPVPASAERNTDLPPHEWWDVRREIEDVARAANDAHAATPDGATSHGTRVVVDYGAPFLGEPHLCQTMAHQRIYIDVHGRLSACCQLSDYGANETDVVADLHTTPFADALPGYIRRVDALRETTAVTDPADPLAAFACLRCARATGKMDWIRNFPDSPWAFAAGDGAPAGNLVSIGYSSRARRTVAVRLPRVDPARLRADLDAVVDASL